MGIRVPALCTALKFAMSCSRGALLEGALKRSRMRRLRARFAPVASGRPGLTVRANYVALPFAGWTRCWMKAGESLPDQGLSFSPVLTRKYGPRLTNRRNGAP